MTPSGIKPMTFQFVAQCLDIMLSTRTSMNDHHKFIIMLITAPGSPHTQQDK